MTSLYSNIHLSLASFVLLIIISYSSLKLTSESHNVPKFRLKCDTSATLSCFAQTLSGTLETILGDSCGLVEKWYLQPEFFCKGVVDVTRLTELLI